MSNNKIKQLFNEVILEQHQEMLQTGKSLFQIHKDDAVSSYYEQPLHTSYADFSFLNFENKAELQQLMETMWKSENSKLRSSSKIISELAYELKDLEMEKQEELSSFIYVMY